MMSLAKKIRTFRLTSATIWSCGTLFLAAGILGGLLQKNVTSAGVLSNWELFNALQEDPGLMAYATLAVAGQALEACAVPVFAFLLTEGAVYTSDFRKYFIRVLGFAAACQLPYNLVVTGSLLKFHGLNPVFAAVICLVMLYFFRHFSGKGAGSITMKCAAILFAYLWSNMLGIAHGAACVIVTAVLWKFRGMQNRQTIFGILAVLCCTMFSFSYMMAPLSFLLLHFYSGEKGRRSRIANYTAYPVLLLIFGLVFAVA